MFWRIVAGAVGLFLMGAVFFYEDEAARLQSKVDDFWKLLSEREEPAVSWHLRFFQLTSKTFADLLDRVFGPVWSVQGPAVAISLALPCFFTTFYLVLALPMYNLKRVMQPLAWNDELRISFEQATAQMALMLVQAVLGPLLGVVTVALAPQKWRKHLSIGLLLIVHGNVFMYWHADWIGELWFAVVFVLFGISLWLFAGVFRRLLRAIESAVTAPKIRHALLSVMGVSALSFLLPAAFGAFGTYLTGHRLANGVGFCLVPLVIVTLIWLLLPIVFVAHWAFWQVTKRPLYLLMKYRPFVENKKWLFGVGLVLLSQAFPQLDLLKFVKAVFKG